ncbi:acid protease [Exidia glandulosa HHB12029]|uniref:Acid protease n=1 Tax=Exidia glandulosa HHB12029 TaxID=1314781 RepID=A0A165IG40_EXIGL|nr:acid protease [Exidia glandulosa HHB12029]
MGFVLPLERVSVRKSSSRAPGRRQELQDADEFAYLLTISVGDQRFPVVLDSGSSDLWIASTECASAAEARVATYNASLSRSFSNSTLPFELRYLTGAVHGSIGWETVLFGPFLVARQTFALVNSADALDLAQSHNSGILGLAFTNRAAIDAKAGTTLLENVLTHVDEADRFFGVRLAREGGVNASNSSFSVGQLDESVASRSAEIAFSAVFPTAAGDAYDYWKLPLHHLTVDLGSGPFQFDLSPSKMPNAPEGANVAVLDTGTTLVLGPSADIARFYALLGDAARQVDGGLWEIKCSRRVGLSFALGDVKGESLREYVVHPFDVSWGGEHYLGWCLGGLQANDKVISGDWLLGDTFLRNVYVTHRPANGATPPILGLLALTDPASSAQEFAQQRGEDTDAVSLAQRSTALFAAIARRPQQPSQSSRALPFFMVALGIGIVLGAAAVLLYVWISHRHAYGRLPPAAAARRRKGHPPRGKKKIVFSD